MVLDVGDKQCTLHFAHRWDLEIDNGNHVKHWTSWCTLHEGVCKAKGCAFLLHPHVGSCHCHPNDQFSKKAGRKIALGRALQSVPRELRQPIWEAYFKICPHK